MKFVQVEALPGKKEKSVLRNTWEEFMRMNVKTVKVELEAGEYASPTVARGVFAVSIKRFGYPIDVRLRDGEIYLIRRDM